MKKHTLVAALCIAALLAAGAAQAQSNVYRWTDKDGKVHFSDTPPPPDAKSSSQKRVGGGYVEESSLPYATQVAMRRNPVTLYTGADCGDPCVRARELLSQRGIPFSERDAQANAADQEALKKLVGGLEVPTLTLGSSTLKGYEEGQWHAALDGAGYPRTRLPGQAATAARTEPKPASPPESKPQ